MGGLSLIKKSITVGITILFIFSATCPLLNANNGNSYNIIYVDDDNTSGPWDGTLEHPYNHIH
jgi:hypothetical protein